MSSAWTLNKKKSETNKWIPKYSSSITGIFFSNLYMDLWKGFDQLLIIYFGHEEG